MLSSREPFFAQQPLNQYPRCMATHVLFATFIGDVDFHVQEQQVTRLRRLRTLVALAWYVQRFRVARQLEQ